MGAHMKTTVEISDALLLEAKALAERENTSLRALMEAGLRLVVAEPKRRRGRFVLIDASIDGEGVDPEFAHASWGQIRAAAYEGRGE